MDADFRSNREHICAVYQPFIVICHDFHLIMNTFKDQVCDNTVDASFTRFEKVDILRTDNNVNRFVLSESFVHAREIHSEDLDKTILHHRCRNDITLTDKICHESILRLVVDFLRSSDLLDVTLVHNYDSVRHGKGFFLIMCYIQESDPQLVLETDQLVLHILAHLEVQSAQRLIQKKDLRLIYDCSCDSDTLLVKVDSPGPACHTGNRTCFFKKLA